MISSIPMYTHGILQRMLTRDLENFQVEEGVFPGRCLIRFDFYDPDREEMTFPFYQYIDQGIREELIPGLGLPIMAQSHQITVDYLRLWPVVRTTEEFMRIHAKLNGLQDFESHIQILSGRMFSTEIVELQLIEYFTCGRFPLWGIGCSWPNIPDMEDARGIWGKRHLSVMLYRQCSWRLLNSVSLSLFWVNPWAVVSPLL